MKYESIRNAGSRTPR